MKINQQLPSEVKQSTNGQHGFTLYTLFEVGCVIGFIIQLTLILINYFNYPITTQVYISMPTETPLPDVVICFDIAFIVNWTRLINLYPQFKSSLGIPSMINLNKQLTSELEIRRYIFTGQISSKCSTVTRRPDCSSEIYFIRPRNPIPESDNSTVITLGQIKEPTIKVVLEPRLKLIDVMVAIGSISGTWFGFSIAEHIPKIYQSSWSKVSRIINLQDEEKRGKILVKEFQTRESRKLSHFSGHYPRDHRWTINQTGTK